MKISIVTVSYNSEKTIEQTLLSVINQNYSNVEYLVIDGASIDKTSEIVSKYIDKGVDVFLSEPDVSLWDAMNKGIQRATGEYIAFLNSDDTYASNSILSEVNASLVQSSEVLDLLFGWADIVDPNNLNKVIREYRYDRISKFSLAIGLMPAHPATFYRLSVLKEIGGYLVQKSQPAADFELLCRLFSNKPNLSTGKISKLLVNMKNGGVSNSSWLGRFIRIEHIYKAASSNNITTSRLFIVFKYIFKLFEYIKPIFK